MQLFNELTIREEQILEQIAQGKSNPQIAAHFDISSHTVHNHIKHIYKKLNTTNCISANNLYWQRKWAQSTVKK